MKVNWTAKDLAELCRRECFKLDFWKSLGIALLWTVLILGIILAGGNVFNWTYRINEHFSFQFIPAPAILTVGCFAGWIHRSLTIRKMIIVISGLVYTAARPFIF